MVIEQNYFTKKEAAAYLRCSLRLIDMFLASGDLRGYKLTGKKLLFARNDLDRFARRRTARTDLDAIVNETVAELRGVK